MKRQLLSVILIFAVWSVIDYVLHGVLLMDQYQATAYLWRPMGQMNMGLIYLCTIIMALVFVIIYDRFFAKKSIENGLLYGLFMGIGGGAVMGLESYACMPIPLNMALVWFGGVVVECVLAGLLVGFFLKPRPEKV